MLRHRMAEKRFSRAVSENGVSSPAYDLDARFLQETLRYYIARLPEHLRDVITLRDLGELSYGQVGRMLGITAGTARVYRCKAIQLLASWMSREKRGI
jgi:RNA polymerase sigma factor (sigma-70 family)